MAFRNRRAIIGPLELAFDTYDGDKTYTIPPLPAEIGLRMRLVADGGEDKELAEMSYEQELAVWLGEDNLKAMRADGVKPDEIDLALLVALADFRRGRASAERVWELGYDPELRAALMAAAAKALGNSPDSQQSPSSAAENSTPAAAATSGTTSPPATPPPAGKKTAARKSAGPKSPAKGKSLSPTSKANTA